MISDKLMQCITAEPFVELNLQAIKARRSLLLCCLIAWGSIVGVSFDGSITVMQTTLIGITPDRVDWLLLGGIAYFTMMLLVHGFESFQKWKLRLTGTTSTEMLHSLGIHWQAEIEATQGVAYKVFRRFAAEIDDKFNRQGTMPSPTDKEGKMLAEALRNYGPKLNLLEKKFWKHQITLVLRFVILDYFGPILFALVTGGYFLTYILR